VREAEHGREVSPVRWEALFADMELQLDAAAEADRALEVANLTRAERATVLLCDRVRGAVGRRLTVTLSGGDVLDGVVTDVGPTWLLLQDAPREHLVPLGSVLALRGLPALAAPPAGAAVRRLGLGHVLRALARDRGVVRVATAGLVALGRVDTVGADHLDLGTVDPADGRPSGERQVVPFSALQVVSST
jgi:hypothetical protein